MIIETETITFNSQHKLPDSLIAPSTEDQKSITFKMITPLLSLDKEKQEMFDNASKLICDSLVSSVQQYELKIIIGHLLVGV